MPAIVKVVGMYQKVKDEPGIVVNTTSKSPSNWETHLSPFFLGPCHLYGTHIALNMENAWQYAKLYPIHSIDPSANPPQPSQAYWDWAMAGWNNPVPIRFPMGRGRRPLGSLWDGKVLDYITARKVIYAPLYAEAVQKTDGWKHLVHLYQTEQQIALRDYDGYDHAALGHSLTDVLNNPAKKMGHAFVLKMLLTQDAALKSLQLRP